MTTTDHRVDVRAPSTQAAPFPIPEAVDDELEWFFSVPDVDPDDDSLSDPVAAAYTKIRGWLLAMDDPDAGVLKAAYRPGPWPAGLRDELGRLTGIVVRMASAEIGWPESPAERDLLEARVGTQLERARVQGGVGALTHFRIRATVRLRTAIQSFSRERGRGPSAAPRLKAGGAGW